MPETKSTARTRKPAAKASESEAKQLQSGTPIRVTPEQRYQMIAEAAYFIAERRAFSGGDQAQDWLEAEAEIERILQSGGKVPGMTPKQAFQSALEAQLMELDARLEELKLKSSLAKLELRSEYEKQLEALNSKRAAAQSKLSDLRNRAEGAWEDLRGGTEKAWEDMREALERLASRFK